MHQLGLAHLALGEGKSQLDVPIALSHLEVERDKQSHDVQKKKRTAAENELALRCSLQLG